jgi:hypothetical protein
MGPLEMFIGWQALVVASIASPLTQVVKTVIDLMITKDRRQGNRVLSRLVMPALPVVFGALAAALLPIRPEVLIEYAAEHIEAGALQFAVYAAWGAACGQFAGTLFDRVREFVKHS